MKSLRCKDDSDDEQFELSRNAENLAGGRSAIDRRTKRQPGYAISQRVRKRIEELPGWIKTTTGLRKTGHHGLDRVGWIITLTATAANLIRLPKRLGKPA